jgi:valyl-tRNA synthetase
MLASEGTDRKALGRAEFEKRVWKWKAEYGGFITGQLRRLGASCDWSRERFTLDEQLSGAHLDPFDNFVALVMQRLCEQHPIYHAALLTCTRMQ